MKSEAVFYHAGCPVCVSAEEGLTRSLDPDRYSVTKVHLGEAKEALSRAKELGVNSVPALVIDGAVYHINHGADLTDLE